MCCAAALQEAHDIRFKPDDTNELLVALGSGDIDRAKRYGVRTQPAGHACFCLAELLVCEQEKPFPASYQQAFSLSKVHLKPERSEQAQEGNTRCTLPISEHRVLPS